MNALSKRFLRGFLFLVLISGILGSAGLLLFSAADLIAWIQADVYTMPVILESLTVRTVEGLAFLPVLLLLIGVCLGLRNGLRLQRLYTASLICAVLLSVAGILTEFLTDGIPAWETVLRQSLVFVPAMLVTADTLLDHRFLIPARLGALGMTALEVLRLGRILSTVSAPDEWTVSILTDAIRSGLAVGYWLSVTLLVFGQVVYYSRVVHKKIRQLEQTLTDANRAYRKGELSDKDYAEKKAQVMKYL